MALKDLKFRTELCDNGSWMIHAETEDDVFTFESVDEATGAFVLGLIIGHHYEIDPLEEGFMEQRRVEVVD